MRAFLRAAAKPVLALCLVSSMITPALAGGWVWGGDWGPPLAPPGIVLLPHYSRGYNFDYRYYARYNFSTCPRHWVTISDPIYDRWGRIIGQEPNWIC